MYPYVFEVSCMNALDHNPETEYGAGLAESYSDAMHYIEEYYGEDLLALKYLTLGEESDIILLSKEAKKEIEYRIS